jgi:hydroxyacylglutathione hydrolase
VVQIHEFVDEGLGHNSYLVDLGDGSAAVVDPPRFPLPHEVLASEEGLGLMWTVDTHSHADYVTGSPGLAARSAAVFVAPLASNLATPHRPVGDGDRVELAEGATLVAIATPGHTPDHHAYLLEARGAPVGLFTGGSLMVGTVGRTDLGGPGLAEPLAHDMYRSLQRFDDLPDDLAVYPTHGAGSFCSAPGGTARTTTLGRERATNPLLQVTSEDEFVSRLLSGFGTFPTYFARLPELNRQGPSRHDGIPVLLRLDAEAVERHMREGGLVVDVRPITAFADRHVPGALSNELRPVFGSWLGWLVAADRPLVFVLDADQDRDEVVRQCLDVGLERLVGELDGGVGAWTSAGRPAARIPLVEVDRLATVVLDVRQADEYVTGHLPGVDNVELAQLANIQAVGGPVTVMCGHGERAMTAASILAARGRSDVSVLDGGPDTWSAATGLPLTVAP